MKARMPDPRSRIVASAALAVAKRGALVLAILMTASRLIQHESEVQIRGADWFFLGWVAWGFTVWVESVWDSRPRPPRVAWVGIPLAVAAFWATAQDQSFAVPHRVPGLDLYVHEPGSARAADPSDPSKGVETFNEHGMRGVPGRRHDPSRRVVVTVGCSRILSNGVGDSDTVPARLEEALGRDARAPAEVFDFSLSGAGPETFAKLVRYARTLLPVDVAVVYIEGGHLDRDLDPQVRIVETGSPLLRFLVAARMEFHYAALRNALKSEARMREEYIESLDRVLAASAGIRLLVVLERSEFESDSRPWVQEWLGAHPEVEILDAAASPEWVAAPRQEDNHHWNPEGTRVVAGVLARRIAPLLDPAPAAVSASGVDHGP
jgi:hypothetical protein